MTRLLLTVWRLHSVLYVLLGSLCLLTSTSLLAATSGDSVTPLAPASISPSSPRLNLTPYIALLEDKTAQLTFAQIREQAGFQPAGNASPNFGFTNSAWWARFSLHNPQQQTQKLIIRQDYPLIDFLDVWYSLNQGEWQQVSTGDKRPFHDRPYDHRTFLIPVTLAPGDSVQVYARFVTEGSMNIGLHVHTAADLVSWISLEYLALGLYYGGFLVLIIYNLIMFLSVRDKAFAYYLLYVLNYGLYMSVHNGISFQYLWPDIPWLANQGLLILLSLSLYWALRFTRSILSTGTLMPRADALAGVMEWLCIASVLIAPFLPYHTMIIPISVLTIIISGQFMTMAIRGVLKGSMAARYYLIAFSALLLSVFVYMFKTFGLLPHNYWTQNAFQVGSLIEMVLLSIAIASRVSEIRQQNYIDELTQLYNRRQMNEELHQEMQQVKKSRQPLTLAVIDIDYFKRFNDSFGHAAGDKALQRVALLLKDKVSKSGTICRFGGEEFVLILPNTSLAAGKQLAESLCQHIQESTQDSLALTISIGLVSTEQSNFSHEHELFEAADFALYKAKNNGRNRVELFIPDEDRRHHFHRLSEASA